MFRFGILTSLVFFAVFAEEKPLVPKPEKSFYVRGVIKGYLPGKSVFLALYSSEEDFAARKYCKSLGFKGIELPKDSLSYEFADLAPGRYMIAAFHDINGDKILNKNFLGIPSEPYCFYKPFTGMFAPTYSACSFILNGNIINAELRFKK